MFLQYVLTVAMNKYGQTENLFLLLPTLPLYILALPCRHLSFPLDQGGPTHGTIIWVISPFLLGKWRWRVNVRLALDDMLASPPFLSLFHAAVLVVIGEESEWPTSLDLAIYTRLLLYGYKPYFLATSRACWLVATLLAAQY